MGESQHCMGRQWACAGCSEERAGRCVVETARLYGGGRLGDCMRAHPPRCTWQTVLCPSPLCLYSHQMLLVNNKEAAAVAQAWMRALIAKAGGGSADGGSGGRAGAGGPRSRL